MEDKKDRFEEARPWIGDNNNNSWMDELWKEERLVRGILNAFMICYTLKGYRLQSVQF